ncbi:MAG: NADH-quinone oxidoreductase subunit NuoG [Anaerolineae bacterium]|nr:NADH-quinone oxidoreductase subunit NuoG [Anaerolineae bacterium]
MTTDRMVHLTIDDQEIGCPEGWTVYEAATAAGIHIPTFCHHEKLVPVGACRMCLVEIEGTLGLQTSCTAPVREGMVVRVHTSPRAVEARRANIEFLLTNHPLDCPVCDKGGECPLQDQALLDGPGNSRYVEEKRHKSKRYPLGEFIVLDQERCVLCWRCIRFLDEWAGDHELDLFGRGAGTRLTTFQGRPLTSKWQGNTIDICPVGALTSRIFRFEARVWELTNTPSICPLCSVGCNTFLGVKNNEVRRITPRENPEINDVWVCDKGRFAHSFVDHPERLTTPLVRRDGKLEPATWSEALDVVARGFKAVLDQDGSQAIAGLGSTRVSNEASYLFQRFVRSVLQTNNLDHLERMPSGATPLQSLPNLEHRDVIVLLGADPSTEAPLVELWIKKAVLRHGAKVIVINPHKIELSRYGGPWLGYRPGSGLALLNSLMRALLDTGLRDRTGRATNVDEVRAWLEPFGPDRVERTTGVQAAAIRQAAELLAQAKQPIILYGPNWLLEGPAGSAALLPTGAPSEQRAGLVRPALDLVANLALLLGGVEAGFVPWDHNTLGALEMGVAPDLYPGQQPVTDNRVRSRMASFWGSALSPVRGLDFDGMMVAAREEGLKAMWILGADPARHCRVAGNLLGQIPFLVVQDLFLTDTASLAEVVLPATSFAESDGSAINLTGRLQAVTAAKYPPGQARADWWIITQLARLMVPPKQQRAWAFSSPQHVLDEMAKVLPGYRNLDRAAMLAGGWQPPRPQEAQRRVFTRVNAVTPKEDPEYPLVLCTGRLLYDRGALLHHAEPVQHVVPEGYVMIHPGDAGQYGLADGDGVSLVSRAGRLRSTVRVSDEVAPGTVFAPLNVNDAPLSVLFDDRWTWPRVQVVK